eukprot:COSAG02_NODE_45060_length_360_cov_1.245211_1_plen_59_part_00
MNSSTIPVPEGTVLRYISVPTLLVGFLQYCMAMHGTERRRERAGVAVRRTEVRAVDAP